MVLLQIDSLRQDKTVKMSDSVNIDTTTTVDMADDDLDTTAGISQLRVECEDTWTAVKDLQKQLDKSQHPIPVNQQPYISILKEKERRLRAEIEVCKEMPLQALPNDPQVIESVVLASLAQEVKQMKETLSLVEAQQQELHSSLKQEHHYEDQLNNINQKLQEKCAGLESQESPDDAVEVVAQELETKINTARKSEQTIMRRMAKFVGKHFPMPDPSQVAKTSKNLRSQKQQSTHGTLPLKDILLELMTKCVETPNDPYLTLDERHWPAYMELLLRCNIILQHPDDDRRVRLVPFHL